MKPKKRKSRIYIPSAHAVEAAIDELVEAGISEDIDDPELVRLIHKRHGGAKWRAVRDVLMLEALAIRRARATRKATPKEDPRQPILTGLEGYRYLPPRIPAGRTSLPLGEVSVAQFRTYVEKYTAQQEKRGDLHRQKVDELHRLAELVANVDAELTMAEALQRSQTMAAAR